MRKTVKVPPAAGVPKLLPISILAVLVLCTFFPVLRAEFVRWDDYTLVVSNPHLNPVRMQSLHFFWTQPYKGLYTPLAYTAWAMLAAIDLSPALFHALNLAMHLTAAILMLLLLERLTKNRWAALAGAAVFAVHPLQLEPVAWVAGMNNVLAGSLSIAAIYAYIASKTRTGYIVATIMFALALLAKPTAVVVPLLAAAIDLLLLKRPVKLIAIRLSPWIALAVAMALITRLVQPAVDQVAPPLPMRLLVAGDALAFYLSKLLWPADLCGDYGRTPAWLAQQSVRYFSWIVPTVVLIAAFVFRRRWPFGLAGVFIFIAGVLPVLGLVPFDYQEYSTVADRYVYLSMLGVAIVIAGFAATVRPIIWAPPIIAAVIVCSIYTFTLTQFWHDTKSVYSRAVVMNPQSLMGNRGMSTYMNDSGKPNEALPYALRAVQFHPQSNDARMNLAAVYMHKGQFATASEQYEYILKHRPSDPAAHYSYAAALAQMGKLEPALQHAKLAVQLGPQDAQAHMNLGAVYAQMKQSDPSIAELTKAVQMAPRDVLAHTNLGYMLLDKGEKAQAAQHFRTALEVNPKFRPAIDGLREAQGTNP